ncbi:hypothetical protein BDU57DRAFT_558850 [Ampelomyces quisqualis]|uniref:Uncharacterized protein n=1 Tax=Ampelomyces quisqualis TaxID=50730 RepID=A0A6A5QGG6_AMPQU|nr:hypothetical protein BDU57DRAFT_558850 [Ampelomyces quisqualis]
MSGFNFTCPAGGEWYACGASTSKFVGCCTSDPCSNGCVQGNIRQGAFDVAGHGKFPDASCGSSSNFFTCAADTTFWGCCKSDPCTNTPAATCKEGDLVPAFMERPEQFNAYAPSSSPGASSSSDGGSSNSAVIGGAVGGGLGGAIIIGVLIFFFCRRRRRNPQVVHPEVGATASTPMMKEGFESRHSAQYGQSPPPTYSSPSPYFYQNMSGGKGHTYQHNSQKYGHEGNVPQELQAETISPAANRYSELPANASSHTANIVSELPAGTAQATAELESPQVSPRPLQVELSRQIW